MSDNITALIVEMRDQADCDERELPARDTFAVMRRGADALERLQAELAQPEEIIPGPLRCRIEQLECERDEARGALRNRRIEQMVERDELTAIIRWYRNGHLTNCDCEPCKRARVVLEGGDA